MFLYTGDGSYLDLRELSLCQLGQHAVEVLLQRAPCLLDSIMLRRDAYTSDRSCA